MDKDQVAQILLEIGTLLELKGENPFKIRAYANAARALETLEAPLETLIAENRLGEVKGIGEAIQAKITQLFGTGKLPYYEELKASLPAGLPALTSVPGLGPKKVKAIYEQLGVASLEQLEAACRAGKIAGLEGFGQKTQEKILAGIEFRRRYASLHTLTDAWTAAQPILDDLRNHPDVVRCSPAGSLRRSKEIIGDLDFVASSKHPERVLDFFTRRPGILNQIARGETKASVNLAGGLQADLRVVSDAEYPPALLYFTGSKAHNIVLRQRALDRGLRLNEYGLFRSKDETRDPKRLVVCETEAALYAQLDLAFIPPELREDLSEFSAAEQGPLPRLLEWTDLRGSLHNHSNWSDGHNSLDEIAQHMQELGCTYWAITDHSKSSFQANGLQPERLERQLKEIGRLNRQLASDGAAFRLLTGTEVDILNGGSLDFPDELLARLDVVIASIHQGFSQNESEITQRLIRAAENRCVHILGHLTGRLLLEREPYKVNQHAVIDACAATGTWIELNANPYRFDLDWRLWQYAKSKGVKCVINCDAHRLEHAGFLRFGAGIARKGWLAREDVINTLPLPALRKELGRKKARHS